MPDIDNVKLDVCDTRRYSESASMKARPAPQDAIKTKLEKTRGSLKPKTWDDVAI